jgi:hypothetical protein
METLGIAMRKPANPVTLDNLGKQLSLPQFKSFLRIDFRRVMSHILLSNYDSKNFSQAKMSSDELEWLECLVEELGVSFDAICDKDYYELLKLCSQNRHSVKSNMTRQLAKHIDRSCILNWGLIETAKYCLIQKLAPENSTTNQFLALLKDELNKPFNCYDRFKRIAFLRFLQYLDKVILDRTSDSSHRKHTLSVAENVEHFIDANKNVLQTWFLKNRQATARLALMVGDVAGCWHNSSHRLWVDMATKFSTISQQQEFDSIESSDSGRVSVSQTLMSLDAKQWQSNLELFALSAKELGDIDLLYGMESLINFSGLSSENKTLVNLITSNLQSNYSETYRSFLKAGSNDEPTKINQLCLIEFLNSCIELNKLDENSDKIFLLDYPNLQKIYEQYLKPSDICHSAKNRFEQVMKWTRNWSFDPSISASSTATIKTYSDLTLPILMVEACRTENNVERDIMIENIRDVIEFESTARFMVGMADCKDDQETLETFLALVVDDKISTRDFGTAADSSVKYRPDKKDQLMYRLLKKTYTVDKSNSFDRRPSFDLVQFRAAKFNLKKGNDEYALNLANELESSEPQDEWVRYSNKLLLIKASNKNDVFSSCHNLVEMVESSKNLDNNLKTRLFSKIFRRLWQHASKSLDALSDQLELVFKKSRLESDQTSSSSSNAISRIELIVGRQDFPIKTLITVAKTLDDQLSSDSSRIDLLNASFKVDLMLLERINHEKLVQENQYIIVETAVRVLDKIKKYGTKLETKHLDTISSQTFIDHTLESVWFKMKSNIISLITCCRELPQAWRDVLIFLIKQIATSDPQSVLFETLVNRFDLQGKLVDSDARLSPTHQQRLSESSILLQHDPESNSDLKPTPKENCKQQLEFWDNIYKSIIDRDAGNMSDGWPEQVLETEAFLREIRKISYLPGEYLKSLTARMNRRLNQYLNLYRKHASPKTGHISNPKHLDECQAKLKAIYRHDSKSIDVLKTYLERAKTRSQKTIYDTSLSGDLYGPLKELDYRFKLLATKKTPSITELEILIKSITELLSLCRAKVMAIHHAFKQKLFMEQISPFLSRLKSNSVLMPGFHTDGGGGGGGGQSSSIIGPNKLQSPITIHKISQSVQMIHSKTAPKKLVFIGSDGNSRPFLLKAHEDLRLDKLIMELFGSINLLFASHKGVRDYKYKLQRYSVTPVSTRSGLIQWIEAPSLCSFYRSWFQSSNGRRIVERLYKETCVVVCPDPAETDKEKHNCNPPLPNQTIDLFYQLLWAKIRSLPMRGLQAAKYAQIARPSSENTLKYRREFPAFVYEEVVERLMSVSPHELIAHQLWFDSLESMDYYLRTREFIRSCAAISMVGYVIGLGDRHPDNILLDSKTGRVTHIDYNICFEIGQRLSIAERVPFRLTQSMIHAFGFAGLEGGFKRSCERVLNLMKEFKSIILHHVDPINLSFMIGGGGLGDNDTANNEQEKLASHDIQERPFKIEPKVEPRADDSFRRAVSDLTVASSKRASATKRLPELNLHSQEDDGLTTSLEMTATSIYDHHASRKINQQLPRSSSSHKLSHNLQSTAQLDDDQIQFDIKTPTMINSKQANDIYGRVRSKLSGNDELLLSRMYRSHAETGDARPVDGQCVGDPKTRLRLNPATGVTDEDLILLIDDAQPTEDQVNALILEAISTKNKAAMFEGWSPWV